MLIALLAVLGVVLIVLVVVLVGVFWRKCWISRQPVAIRGAIRVVDGRDEERAAEAGELKRLGDQPIVAAYRSGTTRIEIAASGEQRDEFLGGRRPDTTQP